MEKGCKKSSVSRIRRSVKQLNNGYKCILSTYTGTGCTTYTYKHFIKNFGLWTACKLFHNWADYFNPCGYFVTRKLIYSWQLLSGVMYVNREAFSQVFLKHSFKLWHFSDCDLSQLESPPVRSLFIALYYTARARNTYDIGCLLRSFSFLFSC